MECWRTASRACGAPSARSNGSSPRKLPLISDRRLQGATSAGATRSTATPDGRGPAHPLSPWRATGCSPRRARGCPVLGTLSPHGRSVLTEYVSNLGSLLEFKKTNGETREISGSQGVYPSRPSCNEARSRRLLRKATRSARTAIARCDETLSGFLWPTATERSAGTTYVLAGEMMFRSTERGRLYQNWKRKSFGAECPGSLRDRLSREEGHDENTPVDLGPTGAAVDPRLLRSDQLELQERRPRRSGCRRSSFRTDR